MRNAVSLRGAEAGVMAALATSSGRPGSASISCSASCSRSCRAWGWVMAWTAYRVSIKSRIARSAKKCTDGYTSSAFLRRTRSEEHTSELQSRQYLVCRLLLEKKKKNVNHTNLLYLFE